MTSYSLFSHSGAPGTVTGSTGTQFIVGIEFEVKQGGCWLQGYWFYAGGATASQEFALWCVTGGTSGGTGSKTGTVIAAATIPGSGALTANSWNYVPLATPVPLAVGTTYVAATGYTIVSPFANASNIFNSGGTFPNGITNGPLFAYNDSAGGGPVADNNPWGGWSQAVFAVSSGTDPTAHLPTSGGSGSYGMDVQVSDADPTGVYAGPYSGWPNNLAADIAAVVDLNDQYVVATEFWLSQACTVSAIRYFSPKNAAQLATAADIWRISDQAQLVHVASPSWTGTLAAGWMQVNLPPGTVLPAGKYKVSVYNGGGTGTGNGATAKSVGYYTTGRGSANITWGPLTIPCTANASTANNYGGSGTLPGQGTFENPVASGPDQYPDLYASPAPGQNYWVDVVVTPLGIAGQGIAVRGRPGRRGGSQGSPPPLVRPAPVLPASGASVRGKRARKGLAAGSPAPLVRPEELLPAGGASVRGKRARKGTASGSPPPLVIPAPVPPASGAAVRGRRARKGRSAGSPPPLVIPAPVLPASGACVRGRPGRRGRAQGSMPIPVLGPPLPAATGRAVAGRKARPGRATGSPAPLVTPPPPRLPVLFTLGAARLPWALGQARNGS